jgi:alkaline phosphatase D
VKSNADVDSYTPPAVRDTPLQEFDDHGLGLEPGNLSAINSLRIYRTLRWGRNVELILTDNRSYRSEPVMHRLEATPFQPQQFPFVLSDNVVDVFDGGREFNHGHPPDEIVFSGASVANPRKQSAPQSMLGAAQKAWFVEKLRASSAPWKVWGNSVGMLEWRIDFQNLPEGVGPKWPDSGYATFIDDDWSAYRHERAEILDVLRSKQITGVVAVCGDRHAFEAGLVSASLPPKTFEPVMAEFVTGSISAPGLFEAAEYSLPKNHPLRPIYLYQSSAEAAVQPAVNFSMMHGVRASLALTRTGDLRKALAERNPQVAPHLSFVDLGGHGYSLVRASSDELEVEFVCVVRPLERSDRADGGPLSYRVTHRVKRWTHEAAPRIERTKVDGTLPVVV